MKRMILDSNIFKLKELCIKLLINFVSKDDINLNKIENIEL